MYSTALAKYYSEIMHKCGHSVTAISINALAQDYLSNRGQQSESTGTGLPATASGLKLNIADAN